MRLLKLAVTVLDYPIKILREQRLFLITLSVLRRSRTPMIYPLSFTVSKLKPLLETQKKSIVFAIIRLLSVICKFNASHNDEAVFLFYATEALNAAIKRCVINSYYNH
ncbi:hypothetical protein EVAR_71861_1 [Eumeta japonica]|uniref:Uncharacterized protein n=1 Tax=Eumeta variegata TaxID=151549 RepID=A0A4C1SL62_EUMVA|nr:hypothetical protein EVAR_71861_1 [Eumeta japonica]